MTKDTLILGLAQFAPPIRGVCPNCGRPIFNGYRCFGCGFDSTGIELEPIEIVECPQEIRSEIGRRWSITRDQLIGQSPEDLERHYKLIGAEEAYKGLLDFIHKYNDE